jgi:hypothetical protein
LKKAFRTVKTCKTFHQRLPFIPSQFTIIEQIFQVLALFFPQAWGKSGLPPSYQSSELGNRIVLKQRRSALNCKDLASRLKALRQHAFDAGGP